MHNSVHNLPSISIEDFTNPVSRLQQAFEIRCIRTE